MARQHGFMVTFDDVQRMIFDGELEPNNLIPAPQRQSKKCMTRGEIEFYTNANYVKFDTYSNNQLVPWHLIESSMYVHRGSPIMLGNGSGSVSMDVTNPNGCTISVTGGFLTPSQTSAATDFTLTCSYPANEFSQEKTGTIKFVDDVTAKEIILVVIQEAADPVAEEVTLGAHTDANTACSRFVTNPITMYIPIGQTFEFATDLYTSPSGTGTPFNGWYSNGSAVRFWEDGEFTINDICQ